MCGKFQTPLQMVWVRVIISCQKWDSENDYILTKGWLYGPLPRPYQPPAERKQKFWDMSFWRQHPQKNFSPFYFASPEIMEVIIIFIREVFGNSRMFSDPKRDQEATSPEWRDRVGTGKRLFPNFFGKNLVPGKWHSGTQTSSMASSSIIPALCGNSGWPDSSRGRRNRFGYNSFTTNDTS